MKSAATAEVKFGGGRQGASEGHDAARAHNAAAATEGKGSEADRWGVVTSTGWALHDQTYAALAHCAAFTPHALHEWVAAECERTQQLPEAFREVWARIAAGEDDLQGMHGTGSEVVDDAGLSELHARLRRQVRHSMHVMMQQDNPGSYYAEIEHMAPT